MNTYLSLTKRQTFVCIAVLLFLGQILPLSLLDGTDYSKFRKKNDPFARKVDVPPAHLASYLLGNLFGGFKQVAIDSLWVKYGRLKEENRYEEAVALLEALRVLQPRRPRVWTHLSWDVSFNISKRKPSVQEEWDMVKRGIDILRKGINRMPNAESLQREMAWIYNIRVPQESFLMKKVWNESAKKPDVYLPEPIRKNIYEPPGTPMTNYRLGVEYLQWGREIARQQNKLDFYRSRYGFMITYSFYDIATLLRYGKYDRAADRVPEAEALTRELINNMESAHAHMDRLKSYKAMPGIIKAERQLGQIPWSTTEQRRKNRTKRIKATKTALQKWGRFFEEYHFSLAEEAARLAVQHGFQLLYYVTNDLERYYRTGNKKFRKRALNLYRNTVYPLINNLQPDQGHPGGRYLPMAIQDLGSFWDLMNTYYKQVRTFELAESEQEKRDASLKLEQVYTDLHDLHQSGHRGFQTKWFEKKMTRLEEVLKLE